MMERKKYSWKRFSNELQKGVEFLGTMTHEEAIAERVDRMVQRATEHSGNVNLIWCYGINPMYCKKLNEFGMYSGWQVIRAEGKFYLIAGQVVEVIKENHREYYRIGVSL